MRTRSATVTAVVAALVLASCGSGKTDAGEPVETATATGPAVSSGSIIVSAAASLRDAFEAIRKEFVTAHPGVEVAVTYGSSGQLAQQILAGAPVDIAAFADETPMAALADAGRLASPAEVFATNRLAIVTKPGNPTGIEGVGDLAGASTVALCVETAPCGKFAAEILDRARTRVPEDHVTRGQDVASTLSAVTNGDASAAIVYVTDANSAGAAVHRVTIPDASNVVAQYPIAVIKGSANIETAKAFSSMVRGGSGRSALRAAGFVTP